MTQKAIFEGRPAQVCIKNISDTMAQDNQQMFCMARVSVKDSLLKTSTEWVPPGLANLQCFPDAVSTMGRPWIWQSLPGGFRAGMECWVSYGIGQFLFGFEGKSLVLICDGTGMSKLGIDLARIDERMTKMSPENLEQLVTEKVVHFATLWASSVLWIPYGWVAMTMGCPLKPGQLKATHAFLPYFNQDLCFMARTAMRPILQCLESFETEDDQARKIVSRTVKDIEAVADWIREVLYEEAEAEDVAMPVPGAGRGRKTPGVPVSAVEQPPRKRGRGLLAEAVAQDRRGAVSASSASVPVVSGHHGQFAASAEEPSS